MQLRAARTLVFTRQEGGLLGCNFLTRSVFGCDGALLATALLEGQTISSR